MVERALEPVLNTPEEFRQFLIDDRVAPRRSSRRQGWRRSSTRHLHLSSPRTRGPIRRVIAIWHTWRDIESRWVWVPAFAGTTTREHVALGKARAVRHDTCSNISTSHSGASIMTSWPVAVVSNVRHVLSALHSA